MDYKELAREIYDLTGPASNIIQAYHCMTRLRLVVKEEHFTKVKRFWKNTCFSE